MCKQKRKKPKLYTLEQVVHAVNHWSMTTVQTENVKQFINGEVKNDKQLEIFHNQLKAPNRCFFVDTLGLEPR